jgi:hypothetical protein
MAGQASGSGVKDKEEELAALMEELGLDEEDLDDVIFEEEAPPQVESPRWFAVAKVHTDSGYSQSWFFANMRSAWGLAQDVKFRAIESNLYILQFFCLGDWEKVMEGGPWNFRNYPVSIEPYDGFSKPSSVNLDSVAVWAQIHDIPEACRPLASSLARRIGKFEAEEPDSMDYFGNFCRVRVKINVREPLKKAVSMPRGGHREIFRVRYERNPVWCEVCGMLGHSYKEHGNGVHQPKDRKYGPWLLADPGWRGRGRGRGGSGRGAGRAGRGRGRGYEIYTEEGTEDFPSDVNGSALVLNENKPGDDDMEDAENIKKRSSTLEPGCPATVGALVNQFNQSPPVIVPPASPQAKRDPKRQKSDATSEEEGKSGSAGSHAEHRRDQ